MPETTQQPSIILGAGFAGLRCAQNLSHAHQKVVLLEKRKHLGGLGTSFTRKGFIFDIGPHKIYSVLPGIMTQYKELMGDTCITNTKKNSLRLRGKYYQFPIKPLQFIRQFNPLLGIRCGLGYATTLPKRLGDEYIISYEDYFLHGFGKPAYELLFKDIAEKVWGDPKKLSADLARRRIPLPSITSVLKNTFKKNVKPEISAKYFYYPKQGLGTIAQTMAEHITNNDGKIYTETPPSRIDIHDSTITAITFIHNTKETTITPKKVISTIHLIDLLSLIHPPPPDEVMHAVKKLKYRSLIIMYLILKKPKALNDHWLFFPEKKYIFTRVAEQKNFSPHTAPPDKTAITAEVGCEFEDSTYTLSDKELYTRIIHDLEKADITHHEDVEEYFTIKINRCYPVYEIGYQEHLATVLAYIDSITNLYTIGRQGLFNYNNTDHSIDMANKLSHHILSEEPKELWKQIRTSFDDYKIVD